MKAAYIEAFAEHGNIKVGQLPEPKVADGEIGIRVAFAGVNPVDAKIAEGLLQSRIPHQFPLILGWEAAGTVRTVGKGVTSFKEGDQVYAYCRKPIVQWGSWAEFLTIPAEHVALAPKNLSLAQAAAIPLAGLTAWQALFDKAHLQPGETVLIHAGAGGVGGFAIQWAKHHKATVLTTVSAAKAEYVRGLGADETIDYKQRSFVEQIKQAHPAGIDVVLDTLGGTTYKESFAVLKPKGRIVSVLEQPDAELAQKHQVRAEFLFVSPNAKQLQKMAELFEQGRVKPPMVRQLPLDQAAQALEEIASGHTQGKLVLQINGVLD